MHKLIKAINDIIISNGLEVGDIDEFGEDTRFQVLETGNKDLVTEITLADHGFIDDVAMVRVIEPELFPEGVLVEKNQVLLAAFILGL
jgi:hypothetical protein